MGTSGNLPQAIFGLGTGAVSYTSNTNIEGLGDVYCDTFSVTGGSTILTLFANRVVARKKITIGSGATIKGDGSAASGNTGGNGSGPGTSGSLGGSTAGGNGGSSAVGANGTDMPGSYVALGGIGGAGGSSGSHLGGGAGATLLSQLLGQQLNHHTIVNGWAVTQGPAITLVGGGTGGAGGGGDTSSGGGGGGGGGNVIYLAAPIIEIDGTLSCQGGAGAAGNAAGNNGGGGGGGGGTIILVYNQLIVTGSINVSGGAAGAGHGSGTAGTAGSAGHTYHVNGLSTQLGPVV